MDQNNKTELHWRVPVKKNPFVCFAHFNTIGASEIISIWHVGYVFRFDLFPKVDYNNAAGIISKAEC